MSQLDFRGLLEIDKYILRALIDGQTNANTISMETGLGQTRVEQACEALLRRGLLQKVGRSYRLADEKQTLAWFRAKHPEMLPERLRG